MSLSATVESPRQPDVISSLRGWYTEAKKARWKNLQDIKKPYRTASILPNNRVVFNIKGNIFLLTSEPPQGAV